MDILKPLKSLTEYVIQCVVLVSHFDSIKNNTKIGLKEVSANDNSFVTFCL